MKCVHLVLSSMEITPYTFMIILMRVKSLALEKKKRIGLIVSVENDVHCQKCFNLFQAGYAKRFL